VVVVRLAKVVEIVLADVGLTLNQYRLLTLIDGEAPSARELSLRLVMKPPNVTALTNALSERGLIAKRRHPSDGRRSELVLTGAGRRVLGRAHARCERALGRLTEHDRRASRSGRLLVGLDDWVPSLDEAAVRLRQVAEADAS
jgi:DNA-binding MarR family transcriptional regulator